MVKKSVDITEDDNKWLKQHSYLNFSKFVRRKIAERRAESIRSHKKERLYNQINRMAEKAKELRDEWDNEVEDLEQEYDANVIEMNPTHWIFEHDGEEYSAHWIPDDAFENTSKEIRENMPDAANEFGNKFVDSWFSKLNKFGDFVDEETDFEIIGGDEATKNLDGKGVLSEFSLYTNQLPTDPESFTIKFDSRVDIEMADLEREI